MRVDKVENKQSLSPCLNDRNFKEPIFLSTMKRKRNEDYAEPGAVDKDIISKLPDNVILQILSSLPTEESIRTGTLSRRWKHMWKRLPNLKFDRNHHGDTFSENVIKTLISHQNGKTQSLTLKVSKKCDPLELAILFAISCAKDVDKLFLSLIDVSPPVIFPAGSLNRQNTLNTLKMMGNFNFNLRIHSVSFNCLKELHLHHVRFWNEPSLTHLLRGCPVLEELVVAIYNGSGIFIFTIESPSLLRLTLESQDSEDEKFVIKTPRLKQLIVKTLEGVDTFRLEDVPDIVDAKIHQRDFIEDENIMTSITSAQSLSLTGPLKEPMGRIFNNLRRLELYTIQAGWCELLISTLICSPKLQILKLIGGWNLRGIRSWTAPDCAIDCVMLHLHTLEWVSITWDATADINVASYILKNAAQLKRETFITYSRATDQTINRLSTVPRAPPSCNLAFQDFSSYTNTDRERVDPDVYEFLN